MRRIWAYHVFLIRMLREQEDALKLGILGVFTRGKSVVEGGSEHIVGGEVTKFPPATLIFRARTLAEATIWLFAGVYVWFVIVRVIEL
jgi:hypothetical protein